VTVAEWIAGSPEFSLRHGSDKNVTKEYITALYRDGLGRAPDWGGLMTWLNAAQAGATRGSILAGIACSEEALKRTSPRDSRDGSAYSRWIWRYDSLNDTDRAAITNRIAWLPNHSVISILIIGGVSVHFLADSIKSVLAQLYPYWELCITLDVAAEQLLRETDVDWARDPRIRVTRVETIGDDTTAGGALFGNATGELVTFLRSGDLLAEQALYEVAVAFLERPSLDLLYADHDEIDASGQRWNPWFKPDWDPDLLLGHNYLGESIVYRRAVLEEVGFLRKGFPGAEFYDLALRATGTIAPDAIGHLPALLYHRRSENQKNGDSSNRTSAVDSARRAVRSYLDSNGYTDVALSPAALMPEANQIIWTLPEHLPLVSVIIPTRDRADLLAQCVDGILSRTDYGNLEVLIVDNDSQETKTIALFNRLCNDDSRVRILRFPGPFNYSALNNAAAHEAKGEILLLLNNDIDVIESGWLRELASQANRLDVGAVGAKLLYADGGIQHGGIVLGPDGQAHHVHRYADGAEAGYRGQLAVTRTLSAVTGACIAMRRDVFFEVGGLDEVNLTIAFNDVDLCLRLGDHGYRVVWTPFATLFHLESASRGLEDDPIKQRRFFRELQYMRRTWGALVDCKDPFHNPNLLLSHGSTEGDILCAPRRRKS
jgi:GT2 family glycosyltransferase